MAGDAIPSTRIESLAVPKLTGGVINATETITTEGVIRAVDDINTPTVQTGIGPIPLTVNGSAVTSLMWSFNAGGVTFSIDELGNPFFKGTIAASGFTNDKLSIDSDGNLDSTGTFRFGGAVENFIDFNGTQLAIDTDNFSVDGAGGLVLGSGGQTLTYNATDGLLVNGQIRAGAISGTDFTGTYMTDSAMGYSAGANLLTAGGGAVGWRVEAVGTFQFNNSGNAVPSNSLLDWGIGYLGVSNSPRLLSENAPFVSKPLADGSSFFAGLDPTGAEAQIDIQSGGSSIDYANSVTLTPDATFSGSGNIAFDRRVLFSDGFYAKDGTGGTAISGGTTGLSGYGRYTGGGFMLFKIVGLYGEGQHGVKGVGSNYGVLGEGDDFDFYAGGSGANYGPFTGAHDSLIPKTEYPEVGDIMCATGVVYKKAVSSTIVELVRSTESRQQSFYGVFVKANPLDGRSLPSALTMRQAVSLQNTHRNGIVNALGEGQINVCSEGGDFEVGDLVCTSSTPGKGMLYLGDNFRVIVARVMEPVLWSDEPEPVKQVACIYLCG